MPNNQTALTTDNLQEARTAILTYRNTCNDIFTKMSNDINSLAGDNKFIGDASNGYADFFRQITPALTKNLTAESDSVTSMLENLLTMIEQMLNPVDPQLGNANSNAAGNTTAPTNN